MPDLKHVIIHTDGAALDNPGRGGLGVILRYGGRVREIRRGYRRTTNNRMELLAAITGLEALKDRCRVTLYSDSQLLVKGIEEGWAERWQNKGWKRSGKHFTENADLWERLLGLVEAHDVEFVWLKGHAGHAENERADRLAAEAAAGDDLAIDFAYEAGETQLRPPTLFDL